MEGKGFTPAGRLCIGNSIVTRAGPSLVVHSVTVESHPEGVAVYNFTVADDHTYFVGTANGGVWVHNECTDIARNMLKKLGGGEIIRVEPYIGRDVGWLSPANGYEKFQGLWGHHDVLLFEGKVYDPMMEEARGAKAWVDYEKWCERWEKYDHVIRPWRKGMEPYRAD